MMKRITLVVGLVLVGTLAVLMWYRRGAEPVPTVTIFNLVSHPILDSSVKGIREGLAESGFGPDRLKILEVNANGEMDKLSAFAAEIVGGKPAVVIPVSTPVTQAVAKAAPPAQQVVYSTVTNPSDVGMDSRPPNMTGVSDAVNYEANVALLRELFPAAKTVGVIFNPGERNSQFGVEQLKRIAGESGLELKLVPVSRTDEVADAARSLVGKVDVILMGSDNTAVSAIGAILKTAEEAKIPVLASDSGSVEQGALAAVSVDYEKLGVRVGQIVAEILRTGKPAGEIEKVIFQGDSLVLNRKTATRYGFAFPEALLGRAAKVIE